MMRLNRLLQIVALEVLKDILSKRQPGSGAKLLCRAKQQIGIESRPECCFAMPEGQHK